MQKVLRFLPESDVLNTALVLLQFVGEHMHYSSRKLILFRIFNIMIFMVLLVFVFMPLFKNGSKNYAETLEAIVAVTHVSIVLNIG